MALDISKYGEDSLEQISNMKFTDKESIILEFVLSQDNKYSDEEYINLAFEFAENNGLND